ncbi:U5 small nuclear ribonucleoprotein component protein [Porphyridium purpureum]|uniref:U5 small nuclear ribonucleoprotein component protein n=1 Tax=Porphyridium purpureum TaxID=35688 RepID=A0A5J4YP92_PORPP|nr:U5 small nuclear ribonucleoprotein component protein [Porphyridium purpureum]|eukprot:POR2841..scf296_7
MDDGGFVHDEQDELFDEFGNLIVHAAHDEHDEGDDLDAEQDEADEDRDDELLDELLASGRPDPQGQPLVIETAPRLSVQHTASTSSALAVSVLPQDRPRFPSASEIYGPDVEIVVGDEDTQRIEDAILPPERELNDAHVVRLDQTSGHPDMLESRAYLISGLLPTGKRVRSVAIAGHLHHGKTSLMDMLMENTHCGSADQFNKYTDARADEQERGMSVRSCLVTLLMTGLFASPKAPSSSGHSSCERAVALQLIDTPGHPDFHDHVLTSMDMCDGVLLVVDVVEGVMCGTELVIASACARGLPMTLLINKIDRLALEMRLPPQDAYLKILAVLRDVNQVVKSTWIKLGCGSASRTDSQTGSTGSRSGGARRPSLKQMLFHPVRGNVCFGSTQQGWTFSLLEFAYMYMNETDNRRKFSGSPFGLAKLLWGDVFYDARAGQFVSGPAAAKSLGDNVSRSFVEFVLNPIYNMYVVCAESSTGKQVAERLSSAGLFQSGPGRVKSARQLEKRLAVEHVAKPAEMIRHVLRAFFCNLNTTKPARGLVGMLSRFVPAATSSAARAAAIERYTGAQNGRLCALLGGNIGTWENNREFVFAHVGMMVEYAPSSESGSGDGRLVAVCRVYLGVLTRGMSLWALGEGFSGHASAAEQDATRVSVQNIYVPCGRYLIKTSHAYPGQIVFLDGLEHAAERGGMTLTSSLRIGEEEEPVHAFLSVARTMHSSTATRPTMRVPLEPMRPSDLPGMVQALRKCSLLYPALQIVVEESGEHAVLGTGELFLDCVLHDLRHVFTDAGFELRLCDPSVCFRESVRSDSALPCFATTHNTLNRVTMIAAPLGNELTEAFGRGAFEALVDGGGSTDVRKEEQRRQQERIQVEFGWDRLAAESVWTFGPDLWQGPNCLLNEVVPGTLGAANVELLLESKGAIVQGFQWSVREGPLCDEPVHGVSVKLIDVVLAPEARHRLGAQLIPASRRSAHSAMMAASPCLLEPIYRVQILCFEAAIRAVKVLLSRRRGRVVHQRPKPGTMFYVIEATLPVMDSMGFETDVRSVASGNLQSFHMFDHWQAMRGDPLDASVVVSHSLVPAAELELAKECMVKTRRRKGLGERSVASYFEDALWSEISDLMTH